MRTGDVQGENLILVGEGGAWWGFHRSSCPFFIPSGRVNLKDIRAIDPLIRRTINEPSFHAAAPTWNTTRAELQYGLVSVYLAANVDILGERIRYTTECMTTIDKLSILLQYTMHGTLHCN